jgi:4,5-dihydroxyphthalate decarboxylase
VWLRGHLSEAYGIAPTDNEWVTERPSLYGRDDATGARIEQIPEGSSHVELLLAGKIDVLVHEWTRRFLAENPTLRRLLPEYKAEEAAYFKATGCFPIIHVLAIRREIVEAHPWVPGSLVRAFQTAQDLASRTMERSNAVVSGPWSDALVEEQTRVFGPDPYPVGLAKTRPEVERMLRYVHEQRLLPEPMGVDELFADDTVPLP